MPSPLSYANAYRKQKKDISFRGSADIILTTFTSGYIFSNMPLKTIRVGTIPNL